MKRLQGALAVVLIFLFGVFCGAVLSAGAVQDKLRKVIEGGPENVVDVVVKRLRHDLHLDSSQQEMLQQIVVETRIQLAGIRQQTQPQVESTLTEAERKVRSILHPNQMKRFDEIVAKGRERWKTGG